MCHCRWQCGSGYTSSITHEPQASFDKTRPRGDTLQQRPAPGGRFASGNEQAPEAGCLGNERAPEASCLGHEQAEAGCLGFGSVGAAISRSPSIPNQALSVAGVGDV